MRILVDLPDDLVKALGELSRRREMSRAAVIREAVSDHLARQIKGSAAAAFGLWGEGETDGMAYQEKIRAEW